MPKYNFCNSTINQLMVSPKIRYPYPLVRVSNLTEQKLPKLTQSLQLKGNPFEHYVAEQEPNIAEYAVKPPYFEAIDGRVSNTSSFILFGDRGAGKSATRLTIFKQVWKMKSQGKEVPLVVNLVDFSSVVAGKSINGLSEKALIQEVSFVVIESILTWLSSLEEEDRRIYLEALDDSEKNLCYELLRDFYLSRPEARRAKSASDAMVLFNQAFLAKSQMWVSRKWDRIAELIGACADILAKRVASEADVASSVTNAIRVDPADFDSVVIMRRLVTLAKIFAFTGIVILVDKVDETEATINSVDRTAELVHPLLAKVQLLEVEGFSWVFFLWSQTKYVFEGEKYPARLDKIGHATVQWDDKFFEEMLNKRVIFYSDKRFGLSGLFESDQNVGSILEGLIRVSMRSPREMIRLLDVIIREHDVEYASQDSPILLTEESIQNGIDKYVTDTITTVYGERLLAQMFRLNLLTFTNKDVQSTFRVGAQSARTRIQSWESAGIIKHIGTRAAEGALGGKPANEYRIVDARVERVMSRQLIRYENPPQEEDGYEETALEESGAE
ncbi:MAG: hypothetical protein J0I23_04760 [Rhizobiales bacterium]|nr:hypothetical protein [Hyphomicrobiales bacterium]